MTWGEFLSPTLGSENGHVVAAFFLSLLASFTSHKALREMMLMPDGRDRRRLSAECFSCQVFHQFLFAPFLSFLSTQM